VETILFLTHHLNEVRDLEPAARARGWAVHLETFDGEPLLSKQLSVDSAPDARWVVSAVTTDDDTWKDLEPAARETLMRLAPSRVFLIEFRTHTLPSLLAFLASVDGAASVAVDEDLTLRVWPVTARDEVLERFRSEGLSSIS
jgi:hypothetical protein